VLVTGASGFVGGHVLERLMEDGWRVRALMRLGSTSDIAKRIGAEITVGELSDRDSLERAVSGVDVVIHLAAIKHATRRNAYTRVNADGCERLADAIRRTRDRLVRVVYLSSYAACGPSTPGRARTVADAPEPVSRYGASKLRGEDWMRALEREGLSVVLIRAPIVYGPRDDGLLPFFRLVRRGWAPLPAGPERLLHLVFAADLALALARGAEIHDGSVPSGTYAVADPTAHSWSAIIDAMAEALGARPRLLRVPAALLRVAGTFSEAGGLLSGRPTPFNRDKAKEMIASAWLHDLSGSETLLAADRVTSLESGMVQTVKWYTDQRWLS
jgi:nucleoside-diphosphate-sugar epimerase